MRHVPHSRDALLHGSPGPDVLRRYVNPDAGLDVKAAAGRRINELFRIDLPVRTFGDSSSMIVKRSVVSLTGPVVASLDDRMWFESPRLPSMAAAALRSWR